MTIHEDPDFIKRETVEWNMKDILGSIRVQLMTLEQEGAYRRALDYFYLFGYLPNNVNELRKLIGKDCSEETARVVMKMFIQHPRFPNVLTHQYVEKLPLNQTFVKNILPLKGDDKAKEEFRKILLELSKNEPFLVWIAGTYRISVDSVLNAMREFYYAKINTGEYLKYDSEISIRKNAFYFVRYSETYKKIVANGGKESSKKSDNKSKYEVPVEAVTPDIAYYNTAIEWIVKNDKVPTALLPVKEIYRHMVAMNIIISGVTDYDEMRSIVVAHLNDILAKKRSGTI